MDSSNSATQPPSPRGGASRAVEANGFNRAVLPLLLEQLPFARLTRAKYPISCSAFLGHSGIMSTWPTELDFHVTRSKQATSQFLIDNFCTHLRRQASKSAIVRSADYCHSPARRSLGEGGSLACPPQHLPAEADRTSSLGFLNSGSNRPSPRLEMPVSHRKQTTGPISNRPKSTVCKFAVLRALFPNSKLSTLDSQLRASHV